MYYGSAIFLIYYSIRIIFERLSQLKLSEEQILLRRITGKTFQKAEAARLWRRINDHKWFLSERLGRDIGIAAATHDYLENFAGEKSGFAAKTNAQDFFAGLFSSFA